MNASQALHFPVHNMVRPLRSSWGIVYHLMRADLFERTRRYSFLITLGFVIFVAYLYLPPKDASYLTLGLGNYRGVYNSAWIGGAVAVLCSTLLSLPAFYLVKDAVERDRRTRVGQILATTPLNRPTYTLGKAFSNFVFLAVAVGVIACAGIGMQLIRGEEFNINLWALLSPFFFCALPAMAMIAAIAILFETISWLRGTFGNVLYFFLWLGTLIATASISRGTFHASPPTNDISGVSIILSAMMRDAAAAFPTYSGGFMIGAATLQSPLQTFVWEGIRWTPEILLGRMLWLGTAIGLSLAAAFFFRRFDPSPEKPKSAHEQARASVHEPEKELSLSQAATLGSIQLTPLVSPFRFRAASLLPAELRLMLKGMRWWWYVIALALVVAGLITPTHIARQLLLAAWLWPLPLWSALGSRENRYRTGQLVFSMPHMLPRQLPMLWLSGVIVALITGSGVAANFILAGEWIHLLAWGTAAMFIPALALALGTWSDSNKLFEVIYMVWWYAGPVNQVSGLDFMGTGERIDPASLLPYWVGTALLLGAAVVGRRHQTRVN